MINVDGLHKSYLDGTVQKDILKGVSFQLNKGQSLALTGESGSGKSTLLHLLAALERPDKGAIVVDQQNIGDFTESESDLYRKSQIGIVFQRFNLIDCLSGWENLSLPARLNGTYNADYLNSLLVSLGIDSLKNKLPMDMSGGEQQRFAIARALAHRPLVLLADEPTGNLDDKTSSKVSDMLFSLCNDTQTTLIVVTHSHSLAQQAEHHLQLIDGTLVNR